MNRPRLSLALERISSDQWAKFEQFASAFLVVDFADLRTMATPSGDGGRDSELFAGSDDPNHLLQYSVTTSWRDKIKATAKRVSVTFPNCKLLTYATNQTIGAKADDLRRDCKKDFGIVLDIRDSSYFLDRFQGDDHLEAVSESLAKEFVDPLLSRRGVVENTSSPLSEQEARTALVFLHLQREDDNREKGLTRLTYEAMVRSVLRNTNSDNRMFRKEIYEMSTKVAPAADASVVKRNIDSALLQLEKRVIRHHDKDDSFCLTHEESERLQLRLVEAELQDAALTRNIHEEIVRAFASQGVASGDLKSSEQICRRVIEKFMFQQGEQFATAVVKGKFEPLGARALRPLVLHEFEMLGTSSDKRIDPLVNVVDSLLSQPTDAVSSYLRGLSDAYTLLAFLKQTDDVQQVIQRMFSGGEIWLDTSLLLPLLAEDLVSEESMYFRKVFAAARDAGVKLYATEGVVEELERHINRCVHCLNVPTQNWQGSVPFLLAFYVQTGRGVAGFRNWIDRFRGEARPVDDLASYLDEQFLVRRRSLQSELMSARENFRQAVKETWIGIHQLRRERSSLDFEPMLVQRLAEHDTENYVGVIMRRKAEYDTPFGFTCWWLALDNKAFQIAEVVANRVGEALVPSPVMSIDFLSMYLTVGPLRSKVPKTQTSALPLVLDAGFMRHMAPELIDAAERIRTDNADLPEYALRRKVRDMLDAKRREVGQLASLGLDAVGATEL